MTLIELKKAIHKKIDAMNDPEILTLVDTLINNKDKNEVFEIPAEHLAGIEQGRQDIENGDYITMEEFEKRYEKWLND